MINPFDKNHRQVRDSKKDDDCHSREVQFTLVEQLLMSLEEAIGLAAVRKYNASQNCFHAIEAYEEQCNRVEGMIELLEGGYCHLTNGGKSWFDRLKVRYHNL